MPDATPEARALSEAWTALDAATTRVRSAHVHELSDAMEDFVAKSDAFRVAHTAWKAKLG